MSNYKQVKYLLTIKYIYYIEFHSVYTNIQSINDDCEYFTRARSVITFEFQGLQF